MRRSAPFAAMGVALLTLAIAALAASALAAPAGEPTTPKTTLNDVEDEVMCPICGTLLELADSPQARRQKVYIARLIAAGQSKAEIKDALLAQYGTAVLAEPEASGFDLSAYLVPAVALFVAVVALAVGVVRWRRRGEADGADARPVRPQGEAARQLDKDLERYDL